MTTWYRRDASYNNTGRAQSTPTLFHLSGAGSQFGRARCAPHGKRRIILLVPPDDLGTAVDDPEWHRCCKRCWAIHQAELEAISLDPADARLLLALLEGMDEYDDRIRQAGSIADRIRRILPVQKLD